MAFATFQDVLDRWVGSDQPTDDNLITALISDAEAIVVATYPGIQARIDSGALSADVVEMVVVRMVTRVLRNPGNLSYWQQATGPFSQGRNFDSETRDVWLKEEEKNLLAPNSRGKAYEVDQGSDAVKLAYDTVWIEVG
jgi:hypothetical protein